MRAKELINKYIATLWVVVLVSFLGLRISEDLAKGYSKTEKQGTDKTFVLSGTTSSHAAGNLAELEISHPWIAQNFPICTLAAKTATAPGFVFYALLRAELIQRLRPSISINAP